jgi:hypothetical protein
MKLSGLLEKLDDLINPIVVKELRQAVKSRLVMAVLLLFLGLQVLVLGIFLMRGEAVHGPEGVDWHAGSELFRVLQIFLLGTCLLLIPAYAWGRLVSERSDTNVDLLFISTLRPRSIILGKFAATIMLALLVFSACAPFMTFTYLMRGIDIPTILLVFAVDFLAMLFGTQLGLFLAALPAPRALKWFLGVLALILLGYLFAGVVSVVNDLLRFGIGEVIEDWEFWAVLGSGTLVVLIVIGLLFCWSVAIISPPSSNRAPAGRLFFLGQWLVTGVVAALVSYHMKPGGHHGPVEIWVIFNVALGCMFLLISVNERDRWGPRVARTIPRRWWLRPFAFLTYSGAGGGVMLSVLMITLTLVGAEVWRWWFPTFGGGEENEQVSHIMLAVALYTYCFSMGAVLLRVLLLGDRVRTGFTWLLTLLLVGLGSSIPAVIAYVVYSDYDRYNTTSWWLLTNPFASVYDVGQAWSSSRNDDYSFLCFLFTGIWAFVTTLLGTIPWVLFQILRFHPPERVVSERRGVASPGASAPGVPVQATDKVEEVPLVVDAEAAPSIETN